MNKTTVILLCALFFSFTSLIAEESVQAQQTPTASINGVHLITGKNLHPHQTTISNEFYLPGKNLVGDKEVVLPPGDSRIGRVREQKVLSDEEPKNLHTVARFFYYPGYTEVIDGLDHKTVYHFSDKELITAVEQYDTSGLYRTERFFWDKGSSEPRLISQVLEEANGQIWSVNQFEYNAKGQLIRETIAGNLSGSGAANTEIDETGRIKSGEKYSVEYIYSAEGQLLSRHEDNGKVSEFGYDPSTKQCISKIIRSSSQIHSRYFYYYDKKGFLHKTIFDDGQSSKATDLTGVTGRQIIEAEPSHEPATLGQPLSTETRYLDLKTGNENLLERVTYSYSSKGQLLSEEYYDTEGVLSYSIQKQYDEKGNLIKAVDSRGEKARKNDDDSSKYKYNFHLQQIALIDKYGNQTDFIYDDLGRLSKTICPAVLNEQEAPYRPSVDQTYDIANNIITCRDGNGNTTYKKFTIRGKPYEIIHPNGSKETALYFLDGTLKETVSINGIKTTYERDPFGQITKSSEYASDGSLLQTLEYTYQEGEIASVTDNKTYTLRFIYDGAGRQIASLHETADGTKRVETEYDATGQPHKTIEWYGSGSSEFVTKNIIRDSWQNIVETKFESAEGTLQKRVPTNNGETQSFVFTREDSVQNERGQFVRREETVDATGQRQLTIFDALGRAEKVEVYNAFNIKLKEQFMRYDANGNKTAERHQVLANGAPIRTYEIRWRYDSMNRLTDILEGFGSGIQKNTHYDINSMGQIAKVVKPDGTSIDHHYDAKGRLTGISSSDGSVNYHYSYDDNQRLTEIKDLVHNQTTFRTYNAFNNVVEETLGNGLNLSREYDLAGRCKQVTLPDGSGIGYRYDGALLNAVERLSKENEPLYAHQYSYNEQGQLSSAQLIQDIGEATFTYNEKGQFKSITSPWWSETVLNNDRKGNILQRTLQDPLGESHFNYNYSDDGQILDEVNNTYDSLYNRMTDEINALNQLEKLENSEFRYDRNGNRTQQLREGKTVQYEYDALDRLISIVNEGQSAVEYIYDSFNRRLEKTYSLWESGAWVPVKSERFIYDGNNEIGSIDQEGHIQELRILGKGKGAEIGAAIALELQGRLLAPIHDQQGSVTCLVDAFTGEVAEFYRYSLFGSEKIYDESGLEIDASKAINPWRYCSKRLDAESGLSYFGKRFYDSETSRWLTPDPLFFYDTPNLYAFVRNNPLMNHDLYGHFSISSIWEGVKSFASDCFEFFKSIPHRFVHTLHSILKLPEYIATAMQAAGQQLLGIDIFAIFHVKLENTEVGVYGNGEKSDKLRVTWINGLFTLKKGLMENLEIISKSHGGINVHYVFRPTAGWSSDIPYSSLIKTGFSLFGFRSQHAEQLAQLWKGLIQDMGGVNGGGVILHYAHSLGATDTDRARDLLTPEEQRMIRVVTIGCATHIRSGGFQSVTNYISRGDYVPYFDPFGLIRNCFDPNSNIVRIGNYYNLNDHPLACETYTQLVERLGKQFLVDFGF